MEKDKDRGKTVCAVFERVLLILTDMISASLKNGINPPHKVIVSLHGARVLINLCKYHSEAVGNIEPAINAVEGFCTYCCGTDIITRIECELHNVEDSMVIHLVNIFGEEYLKPWQEKIKACWEEVGKLYAGSNV